MARALERRNQKAKAKIAAIVGKTIASMIAIESIRMTLSAAATGPCGSRIFIGGSRRAPRFQENPFQRRGFPEELGRAARPCGTTKAVWLQRSRRERQRLERPCLAPINSSRRTYPWPKERMRR